jgi:hypothetical protein
MTSNSSSEPRIAAVFLWQLYFALVILQGIITLGLIFQSPSESSLFLGLSSLRGALVAAVLGILMAAGWTLTISWRKPQICIDRLNRLAIWLDEPGRFARLTLLTGLILAVGSYQLTLIPELEEPFTARLMARLVPVIFWVTGLCAQTLAALVYIHFGKAALKLRLKGKIFWAILAYFAAVFLFWSWATRSVIPAASEKVGWNLLGSPILESQVLLAWVPGLVLLWLVNRFDRTTIKPARLMRLTPHKTDLAIAGLIWLGAVLLWQSTPITPNWFLSERLDPNQAYYPYSDARHYDRVAQSALIGEGFKFFNGWDVRRPLHGAYLTVLHLIAGQDYEKMIALQVLLLALLPVALYFLTSSLYNRVAGVVAAGLVILREANSISITGRITTSNVKLLMVDLFVALAVVFFAILAVKWLQQLAKQVAQQVEQPAWLALFSGSALGLAMLIRLETAVLALAPALIASLTLLPKRKYAQLCKQLALFSLGVVLVISPWVYRNWQRTGLLFVDSPLFHFGIIYQRFQPAAAPQTLSPEPVESEQDLAAPVSTAVPNPTQPGYPAPAVATSAPSVPAVPGQSWVETAAQNYWSAALKKPGELISYALAHFTNSQIQSILIFPTAYRGLDSGLALLAHRDLSRYLDECCSITNYSRQVPYWHKWDGAFPSQSILPILFSILIIATGFQATWNKNGLVSLMPMFMLLTYLGFNAALRNSGGRYILPVDWGFILFYSIGIVQITTLVFNSITGRKLAQDLPALAEQAPAQPANQRSLFHTPKFYAAAAGFFLIGCSIPIMEVSFPERYTPIRQEKMLNTIYNSPELPANVSPDLQAFLSNGGVAIAGRALYPQFFPAGYGTQDIDYEPLAPKPYPRMVFDLTGTTSQDLALPFDKRNFRFPNASDVLVFLCPSETTNSGDPLAVAVFDANERLTDVYLRTPYPTHLSCPLPAVNKSN